MSFWILYQKIPEIFREIWTCIAEDYDMTQKFLLLKRNGVYFVDTHQLAKKRLLTPFTGDLTFSGLQGYCMHRGP